MFAKLRPRSAYDVMAALALFVALGTGGAYAANTIGSADVIDNSLQSEDIKNFTLRGTDLKNASIASSKVLDGALTGADIADQSGVDTCIQSARYGQLCARVENQDRNWANAFAHCANLDLRLPSLTEAKALVQTRDIPGVEENEWFWTGNYYVAGNDVPVANVVSDDGTYGQFPQSDDTVETVCVTTPTN